MTLEDAITYQQYHESLTYLRAAQEMLRMSRKSLSRHNSLTARAIGGHLRGIAAIDETLRSSCINMRNKMIG